MIYSAKDGLIGKKFDKILVVRYVGKYLMNSGTCGIYECLCDCGTFYRVLRPNIIKKGKKSCGCIKRKYKGCIKLTHMMQK